MRLFFLSIFATFFLNACMYTSDPEMTHTSMTNKQIQENKTEAQMAQEEYLTLQTQRSEE